MAVFPDGNPGVWPIDGTTDVGRFRYLFGDTTAEAYDPVEPGYRNYEEFSDGEIEAFLALGDDSLSKAMGYAYLQLAGKAAKESESIKDYDLAVDLTKKASDYRAIAAEWFDRADDEDNNSGGNDIFELFDTVPTCRTCELAEHPTCHCRW